MNLIDRLRWCLITSFGLGLAPVASGTFGTLGGVALAVTLQWAMPGHVVLSWSIAAVVLFVYGCLETRFVERTWPKKDPGQFVLDEVVGYLVTVIVYALVREVPDAVGHMAAFFAFRVFDVLKIQPCKKLEDLPGALGIMADDQMAGVYAGLSMWLVLPLLGQ
ncbi:MAG: phosphatidylglycerophosphatase A [Planctomycetes bacterium]|nr:phosphatidylglycerophosphatase A [Planctomycetota bacterium]